MTKEKEREILIPIYRVNDELMNKLRERERERETHTHTHTRTHTDRDRAREREGGREGFTTIKTIMETFKLSLAGCREVC